MIHLYISWAIAERADVRLGSKTNNQPTKPKKQNTMSNNLLAGTMKIGVLTAAVQTPPGTNSNMFINEPRQAANIAALKWIDWARTFGVQSLELGCAHAPKYANIPAELMADPVAHHTPILTYKDGNGIDMLEGDAITLTNACDGRVVLGTLGVFENLLHKDPLCRRQNIEHVRRAIRGAETLQKAGAGTEGVTIFIGRNTNLSIEENMRVVAEVVIPIVRYGKLHSVKIYIENCPMCGWTSADTFTQNIANVPLHWIIIARMIEAAGLRGWCFLNHDASHDILQGFRPEWSFKVMRIAGYGWFIRRFHGKDLSTALGLIAAAGYLGQRIGGGPWDRMNGDQPLPGAQAHNALATVLGHRVDWLGAQISARSNLDINPEETTFTIECEQSQFRNREHFKSQEHHFEVVTSLLLGSIKYMTGIEIAAQSNFELGIIVGSNSTLDHPKTWDWHEINLTSSANLGGLSGIINSAKNWVLPPISETSDFFLGSDLSKAA